MIIDLRLGDCVDVMNAMPEHQVDSIVCDPPYGIAIMDADFDRLGEGPAQQEWHKRWAQSALRVIKPGGYLLAFGSPRTFHRLASGIEDAGFELRDTCMWLQGKGMPKAKGVLKPAFEPIVMARKPVEKTIKANVAKYGTGNLNIDSCRIPFASEADEQESKQKNRHADFDSQPTNYGIYSPDKRSGALKGNYNPPGRWPANVVFSHDLNCAEDVCVTDCPVNQLGDPARFFYAAKASTEERNAGLDYRNPHLCVKPKNLMAYFIRLVTPPGGLVLDPFMGSGSTGLASLEVGCSFIGIEKDPQYFQVAQSRIDYAKKQESG